jgi:copper transport protein
MIAGMPSRPGQARTRAARLTVTAALALLVTLALPATAASAHANLVSTTPPANAILATAPTEVLLTFSEAVRPVTGKVRVVAPDGSRVSTGEPTTNGHDVRIPMRGDGPNGTYLVSWRVVSADSHPIAGAFTFSVGAPSPGGPPTDTGLPTGSDSAVTAVLPEVRWLGYIGLVLLVGSVLVLSALWPRRLDRAAPTRLVWLGTGLVALATIGEAALQIPYVAGGFGQIRASDVQEALGSQYGAAHVIRLGVLAAALFLIRPVLRGRAWAADRVLLAVLGVIGLGTWAVSGHPSASPAPMVTVLADLVHIGAMSVWIGGLVVLSAFLLPRANARELGAIVPVWSRWATTAVGALLVTGAVQALVEIGTPAALFRTTYGWLVLTKIGLVGVILLVALFSRRLVEPIVVTGATLPAAGRKERIPVAARTGGATDQAHADPPVPVEPATPAADPVPPEPAALARRLRRLVMAEAVIAAVVIGVASVLVQTTPARSATAAATQNLQSTTLTSTLYSLTVDLQPATTGPDNVMHLFVYTLDGKPLDVAEWTVTMALPAKGIEPITVPVLPILPSHATAQVTIPASGTWTFRFTLRTTEIDQATVVWLVKVN